MSVDTLLIKNDTSLSLDNFFSVIADSNKLFRVFGNSIYLVEDPSGLIIYSIDSYKSDFNFFSFVFPEIPFVDYKVRAKEYYFSNSLTSDIAELNLSNIEKVVHKPQFLKRAKRKFRWYNYDIHERYKSGQFMVNRLYQKYASE